MSGNVEKGDFALVAYFADCLLALLIPFYAHGEALDSTTFWLRHVVSSSMICRQVYCQITTISRRTLTLVIMLIKYSSSFDHGGKRYSSLSLISQIICVYVESWGEGDTAENRREEEYWV